MTRPDIALPKSATAAYAEGHIGRVTWPLRWMSQAISPADRVPATTMVVRTPPQAMM